MRTSRLLTLLEKLRKHHYPITATQLATQLNVSLRTIYRDIATLKDQGVLIEGEPGIGYRLSPGVVLPPLTFREEEIEALVLGIRWVSERGDSHLVDAATGALAKINAVLPETLRNTLQNTSLLIGPHSVLPVDDQLSIQIRQTIHQQRKSTLVYQDQHGHESKRIIWPFGLGFFEQVLILLAWCETRADFRHFRIDRVLSFTPTQINYPTSRQALLNQWKERDKNKNRHTDKN
jgi:predicted DNA-binding transcriptional regulator YafY